MSPADRILLLSRNPQAHGVMRLQQAAELRGLALALLDPHELVLRAGGVELNAASPDGELDLARIVVIPRIGSTSTEYALAALEHLEAAGARTLNPAAGVARLRNKFNMLGHLAAAGVPVPDSVLLRSGTQKQDPDAGARHRPHPDPAEHSDGPDSAGPLQAAVNALGGYPLVVKFIRGSQGLGVIYATDETVVGSVLEAMNYAQYDVLLQRYYPQAASSDVRVIVLGGKARWAVRRTSQSGRFRSNIHRGGTAEGVDLAAPRYAPYGQLAQRAAAVFGLGLAGVDIIENPSDGGTGALAHGTAMQNELLVLEVNSSPGFEAPEAAHGVDIAGAILEHALDSRM